MWAFKEKRTCKDGYQAYVCQIILVKEPLTNMAWVKTERANYLKTLNFEKWRIFSVVITLGWRFWPMLFDKTRHRRGTNDWLRNEIHRDTVNKKEDHCCLCASAISSALLWVFSTFTEWIIDTKRGCLLGFFAKRTAFSVCIVETHFGFWKCAENEEMGRYEFDRYASEYSFQRCLLRPPRAKWRIRPLVVLVGFIYWGFCQLESVNEILQYTARILGCCQKRHKVARVPWHMYLWQNWSGNWCASSDLWMPWDAPHRHIKGTLVPLNSAFSPTFHNAVKHELILTSVGGGLWHGVRFCSSKLDTTSRVDVKCLQF